jgi:hypothetical protein
MCAASAAGKSSNVTATLRGGKGAAVCDCFAATRMPTQAIMRTNANARFIPLSPAIRAALYVFCGQGRGEKCRETVRAHALAPFPKAGIAFLDDTHNNFNAALTAP